jgi:hypothetical protein
MWIRLGILKPIVEQSIEGTLTEPAFYKMLRARREDSRYQREMLERLEKKGRPSLIVQYCSAILERRGGPKFRKALKGAQSKLNTR